MARAADGRTLRLTVGKRRFDIDELDEVMLARNVASADGLQVPAGSTGTVVAVWGAGEAYEVEFDKPFHALATVSKDAISDHRPAVQ